MNGGNAPSGLSPVHHNAGTVEHRNVSPAEPVVYWRLLVCCFKVTTLAIHFLRTIRGIRRPYVFTALGAFSIPESAGVPHRKATAMTLIGGKTRNGEMHFSVKFEFLRNNLVELVGGFTGEDLFADLLPYCRNILRYFGFRPQILLLSFILLLPLPAALQSFFLCKREILRCNCFVIAKGRNLNREELAPFLSFFHVFDDFGEECLILFLRILLIQDAILAVTNPNAAKQVMTAVAGIAVAGIGNLIAEFGEE